LSLLSLLALLARGALLLHRLRHLLRGLRHALQPAAPEPSAAAVAAAAD
jgi:hypothetical protein